MFFFHRKSCYYCKFCYKVKKELSPEELKELGKLAEETLKNQPKISDLTEEDLSDMYGLRQEYYVKCFKGQWDEELHPELKTQSLKKRTCKYFLDRKKNHVKTYEQAEKEQIERMSTKMHKESIEWMQVSFLVGIASLMIGLLSRIPNIGNKLMDLMIRMKNMIFR